MYVPGVTPLGRWATAKSAIGALRRSLGANSAAKGGAILRHGPEGASVATRYAFYM